MSDESLIKYATELRRKRNHRTKYTIERESSPKEIVWDSAKKVGGLGMDILRHAWRPGMALIGGATEARKAVKHKANPELPDAGLSDIVRKTKEGWALSDTMNSGTDLAKTINWEDMPDGMIKTLVNFATTLAGKKDALDSGTLADVPGSGLALEVGVDPFWFLPTNAAGKVTKGISKLMGKGTKASAKVLPEITKAATRATKTVGDNTATVLGGADPLVRRFSKPHWEDLRILKAKEEGSKLTESMVEEGIKRDARIMSKDPKRTLDTIPRLLETYEFKPSTLKALDSMSDTQMNLLSSSTLAQRRASLLGLPEEAISIAKTLTKFTKTERDFMVDKIAKARGHSAHLKELGLLKNADVIPNYAKRIPIDEESVAGSFFNKGRKGAAPSVDRFIKERTLPRTMTSKQINAMANTPEELAKMAAKNSTEPKTLLEKFTIDLNQTKAKPIQEAVKVVDDAVEKSTRSIINNKLTQDGAKVLARQTMEYTKQVDLDELVVKWMNDFGKKVPTDGVAFDKLTSEGFKQIDSARNLYQDRMLPNELADSISKYVGSSVKEKNIAAEVYREAVQFSKALMLYAPEFVSTNVVGAVHNIVLGAELPGSTLANALSVGRFGKSMTGKVAPELQNLANKTVKIQGKTIPMEELFYDAATHGVIQGGQFAKEMPLTRFRLLGMQAIRNGAMWQENTFRVGHYLTELQRGLTKKEASISVKRLFIDYADLSESEQFMRSYIFPFYSFWRKNMQLQADMIASRPARYGTMGKLIESMGEDEGYKKQSDYERQSSSVYLKNSGRNGAHTTFTPQNLLPFFDVNALSNPNELASDVFGRFALSYFLNSALPAVNVNPRDVTKKLSNMPRGADRKKILGISLSIQNATALENSLRIFRSTNRYMGGEPGQSFSKQFFRLSRKLDEVRALPEKQQKIVDEVTSVTNGFERALNKAFEAKQMGNVEEENNQQYQAKMLIEYMKKNWGEE